MHCHASWKKGKVVKPSSHKPSSRSCCQYCCVSWLAWRERRRRRKGTTIIHPVVSDNDSEYCDCEVDSAHSYICEVIETRINCERQESFSDVRAPAINGNLIWQFVRCRFACTFLRLKRDRFAQQKKVCERVLRNPLFYGYSKDRRGKFMCTPKDSR